MQDWTRSYCKMDYNTLKKLAFSMGEEFQIIDNVTLEAINVQRLITKEKEYCSSLEVLIKSSDEEITSLESETVGTKNKLDDVINRRSLLKTSLESLKQSQVMVGLLKGDLLKQLQLQVIRTSEQNTKFESTIRKYEETWEIYKEMYRNFPLVFDLQRRQAKVKLNRIQLSVLEIKAKDYEKKISEFNSIQDKKEKLLLINVAEKYLLRDDLKRERDDLDKRIQLKRDEVEIEKLHSSRLLSYESSPSLLKSDLKNDNQISNTLSILMDNFLTELAKENSSFAAEKGKMIDEQHGSFMEYEAVLNSRTSDPVLKLSPLPAFDSPPRKVRSVGNLLSPPKEWTRECAYEAEKCFPCVEMGTNNLPTNDSKDANIGLDGKEPADSNEIDMDYIDSDPSNSYTIKEISENKSNIGENQMEMPMEIEVSTGNDEDINSNSKFEEKEDNQMENKDIFAAVSDPTENTVGTHGGNDKSVFPSDSPEFSYEPRNNKITKMVEKPVPETTSQYFVASSFLDFMDVSETNVKKEMVTKKRHKEVKDEVKENIPVIDLCDSVTERNYGYHDKTNVHKVDSDIRKEYPEIHHMEVKSASNASNQSGMEIGNEDITHNDGSCPNKNTINKQSPEREDCITVKKRECSPGYNEQRICENIPEVSSSQLYQMHDDLNISYGSPTNYSQVSYADSIDYQDPYQSFSPGVSSIDESPQFIPGEHGHSNLFGSCSEKPGFTCRFSPAPQRASAASLFGSSNSGDKETKERKQNEVFNFSFDTKSKTSSMFKLF